MNKAVRLEIITGEPALAAVKQVLDRGGAPGYSIIEHVKGRGQHGPHRDDDLTGASASVCVIVVCGAAQAQKLADQTRPILERFGGVCTSTPVDASPSFE